MNTELLLNRDMNNIVFEGRNMAYGAYALRRKYEDRMTTAMLAGIMIFITLFLIASALQKMGITEEIPMMTVVKLDPDPIFAPTPVIPKPKPAEQPVTSGPKKPQIKFVPPVVVPDDNPMTTEMPTTEQLKNNVIGKTTVEGPENADAVDPGLIDEPGTPSVIPVEEPVISDAPREMYAVDQMPEFPGGKAEMYKFIRKNLVIPVLAKEMNESMNAIVQFIIDKNGNVRDVKIIRSSSAIINTSAINVVNEMPKWKPGKVRGQSVSVIFKLPIKIQIQSATGLGE